MRKSFYLRMYTGCKQEGRPLINSMRRHPDLVLATLVMSDDWYLVPGYHESNHPIAFRTSRISKCVLVFKNDRMTWKKLIRRESEINALGV